MIIALLKGLIAGLIGSLIASLLVSKVTSSDGGALSIHLISIADHQIHWSWPLFIVLGAFSTALFKMME